MSAATSKILSLPAAEHSSPEAAGSKGQGGDLGLRAVVDVIAERERQKAQEGCSTEGDDRYTHGELQRAGAWYALNSVRYTATNAEQSSQFESAMSDLIQHSRLGWPFAAHWFKPRNARADLVRAAALLLAEIERLDRAEAKAATR